ncbi:MAG: hypothetical protein F6K24_09725 [Okeania sp. SIO2D1]|nr:hypothetical protein [Okeania sp. SIO2D1]
MAQLMSRRKAEGRRQEAGGRRQKAEGRREEKVRRLCVKKVWGGWEVWGGWGDRGSRRNNSTCIFS